MASSSIPPVLAVAAITTPTKAAQDRFFDMFPALVKQSTDNEPDTLSYYFFTNTSEDDYTVYGFEAYPTVAALVDVHSQSEAIKRQGAIIESEKLCTVEADVFKPVGGFLLRQGESAKTAGLIVINKAHVPAESKSQFTNRLAGYAAQVEKDEVDGCATFVAMENTKTGEIWTFERYHTRAYYTEKHVTSRAFLDLFGDGAVTLSTTEFNDANIGFLTK